MPQKSKRLKISIWIKGNKMRVKFSLACMILSISILICGCGKDVPEEDGDQRGKQSAASEDAGKTETTYIVTKAQGGGVIAVSSTKYLEAHNPAVKSLAITPEKTMVASGDSQGKIALWSLPDLRKIKEISLKDHAVLTIAFSRDGKFLYTGGGDWYGVLELSLEDYSQRLLTLGATGTILFSSPLDGGKNLVTVTAANELLVQHLPLPDPTDKAAGVELTLLSRRKIFGGFIRHVELSKDRRFLAVTSQNEIDDQSAQPQKLTILDLRGKAETSYTFKSGSAYSSSTICFSADSRTMWLHTYEPFIRAFEFDDNKQGWSMKEIEKAPSKVYYTASCTDPERDTLFLAGGERLGSRNNIYVWDSPSKRLRKLALLSIGRGGKYASDEIEELLWISNPPRLVAALQDGKLAIMALEKGVDTDARPFGEDLEVLAATVKDISFSEEFGRETCVLLLGVEFPQEAVSANVGKLESAITDTGRSVLPEDPSQTHPRLRHRPQLGQNGRTCEFRIDLPAPKFLLYLCCHDL